MAIKDGTKKSGFVTETENHPPRECGNCKWFKNGCTHPEVIADPEVPKNADGTGAVDADDCCDYFQNRQIPGIYSENLNRLLANSIVLRDLYRKYHWQVSGPNFFQLHTLFDKHYEEQDELVDMIAERIQSLHIVCVASASDVIKYATLEQPATVPEPPEEMLKELHGAHQIVIDQCKKLADQAELQQDKGSNDLIVTDVLRKNEKQQWFISEQLGEEEIVEDTKPCLLVLRHGETKLNADAKFRSWRNVPLDENGIDQASAAAAFLRDCDISEIWCSPLDRAHHTAMIVADGRNIPIKLVDDLKPWHLGVLSGKSRKDNAETLNYYIDHPDETIEDGESLDNFRERSFSVFDQLTGNENGLVLVVGHTSTITALNQWADDNYTGRPEIDDESVKPGGVCGLFKDNGEYKIEVVFGTEKKADYGS